MPDVFTVFLNKDDDDDDNDVKILFADKESNPLSLGFNHSF